MQRFSTLLFNNVEDIVVFLDLKTPIFFSVKIIKSLFSRSDKALKDTVVNLYMSGHLKLRIQSL